MRVVNAKLPFWDNKSVSIGIRIDDWAFGLLDTKKETFLSFVRSLVTRVTKKFMTVSSVGLCRICTVPNREMTDTECLIHIPSFACELLRFCATTNHMYCRSYEYYEKFDPTDSCENANFGNLSLA